LHQQRARNAVKSKLAVQLLTCGSLWDGFDEENFARLDDELGSFAGREAAAAVRARDGKR
jgi:hypothetical protein